MIVLNQVVAAIVAILIISFGTGMLFGGPAKGRKIVSWELKKLKKTGLWLVGHSCKIIGQLGFAGAKACGVNKKRKP